MVRSRHIGTGLVGAAFVLTVSTHVSADEYDALRSRCEPTMTVVTTACSILNVSVCPNGDRVHELIGSDGTRGFEVYDSEYGLVSSVNPVTGSGWRKVLRTDEAFSLSELLQDGHSSGSYLLDLLMFFPAPRPAPATLEVRLTGTSRVLDDVTFDMGVGGMALGIGTGGTMATIDGPVFIDRMRRLVLFEVTTMKFNGATMDVGEPFISVILPGEPDFMAQHPLSDCSDGVSSLTPLLERQYG